MTGTRLIEIITKMLIVIVHFVGVGLRVDRVQGWGRWKGLRGLENFLMLCNFVLPVSSNHECNLLKNYRANLKVIYNIKLTHTCKPHKDKKTSKKHFYVVNLMKGLQSFDQIYLFIYLSIYPSIHPSVRVHVVIATHTHRCLGEYSLFPNNNWLGNLSIIF